MGDFSFLSSGPIDTAPFVATVEGVKFASMWGPADYYGIWLVGGKAGKMRITRGAPCPVDVGQEYTFCRYIERNEIMIKLSKQPTPQNHEKSDELE